MWGMWGITVVHTTQAAHWMQRGQPRFFYECHCSNCACMVTYIPLLCPCVSMHGRSDCVHMDNSDQLAARLSLCVEHPVSHMYLENKYGTIHGVWGVVYTLGIMVQSPITVHVRLITQLGLFKTWSWPWYQHTHQVILCSGTSLTATCTS